jgi:hypothetical protein
VDDPNVEPGTFGQDGQLRPVPLPGHAVEGVDQGEGLGRLQQTFVARPALVEQPLEEPLVAQVGKVGLGSNVAGGQQGDAGVATRELRDAPADGLGQAG